MTRNAEEFMLKTKYDVLVRNGKERFVVVPEKDYKAMRERVEDEIDFLAIEESKKTQANSPDFRWLRSSAK